MADEARAMLDALMGGDRNAPLPAGSSLARGTDGTSTVPARRKRSCYDTDVCPLYCAWGVDVYDLFTNTKSDLGPNPYIVDDAAREEFVGLPDHERERLGYESMLFRKLSDLVRGCDRTVARNRDKLRAEISRASRSRGSSGQKDPAEDVSDEAIEACARNVAELELLEEEAVKIADGLTDLDTKERKLRDAVRREKEAASSGATHAHAADGVDAVTIEGTDAGDEKKDGGEEAEKAKAPKDDDAVSKEDGDKKGDAKDEAAASEAAETTEEEKGETEGETAIDRKETEGDGDKLSEEKTAHDAVKTESEEKLVALLSERRSLLAKLADLSASFPQLRDAIDGQLRQLHYVRSDTASDKTVCDVSGNFMSSRDADERIAAHYAGKQYVGWKMVRDKLKDLVKKYGKSGPPAPRGPPGMGGGGFHGGPPPPQGYGGWDAPPLHRGGGGGYGGPPPPGYGGYHRGNSGDWDRGGGGGGGGGGGRRDRSRSRERDRGRSRGDRRDRSPGRWERDRGYSGGDRGGGRRDHRSGRRR